MTDDIRDDLAYVKALAEEGRDTPLVGGVYYVLWGSLIALASAFVYAQALKLVDVGGLGWYVPWIAVFVIGWAASIALGRRTGAKPGAATLGNRTAGAVWFAVGVFMTGFWFTLMIVHDNFISLGVPPNFLFSLMFPIGFGLYGVAFYATAAAGRLSWLKWCAVAAWICSALALSLMATAHQLLVGAIGSLVCVVLPGLIMMRGEPSEVV